MPRSLAAVEVSTFVGGLITEASPLTFPEDASINEDNFLLNRDGSRSRRLGFDLQTDGSLRTLAIAVPSSGKVAFSSFTWTNAGGDPAKAIAVVQIGRGLHFYDTGVEPLSDGLLLSSPLGVEDDTTRYSYAVVDGSLVVASGDDKFIVFSFDGLSTITRKANTLLVRDFFGVEDVIGGEDLKEGTNITTRPSTLSSTHLYNLRNQSWALPRRAAGAGVPGSGGIFDPIDIFTIVPDNPSNLFPSNIDTVTYGLEPDPNNSDGTGGDTFFPETLLLDPIGNTEAAEGHFIIDVMSRGNSRRVQEAKLRSENPTLIFSVTNLPNDYTEGGPSSVAEFAGRAWFGGFSGAPIDGDSRSPSLGSYVLFSQLVSNVEDLSKCYQVADPTDKDDSELVDTDGGFIRVNGCYGIQAMVNIKTALIIVAANGVWAISGGDDSGFTANNFRVDKLSDHGSIGNKSVVLVDSSLIYWGDDGIYQVATNELGQVEATNISQSTIQSFYNDIPTKAKASVQGVYDSYDRKVRWVYNCLLNDDEDSRELVLDVNLSAFYPSTIGRVGVLPKVITGFEVPPFKVGSFVDDVTVSGVVVTAAGEDVTITSSTSIESTREILYLVVTATSPSITYGFGTYSDIEFTDWKSIDGTGIDAPAFLLTGYRSEGDFQRYKKVPYLTVHMQRTEDGFEDVDGDIVPKNTSSCKVQAQWNWANSAAAGRWSKEFEAYRFRRVFMPTDVSDDFDDGELVLSTRNKLRGKGKVLSLQFRTSPKKDLKLLGWSMIVGANANV